MNQKKKAILCMLVSTMGFASMSAFVRLAGDLPGPEKAFFRNLVALAVATVLLLRSGEGFHFQPRNLPLLVVRSTAGTVGILCNFYAVDHLVLSNASILNKMSPFFVLIFSYLFLKETITVPQLLAILTAFGGSLFVVQPNFANADLVPSLIGLLGGMGAGLAYSMVRVLGLRGERSTFIVFFFSAFSCLATLPALLFHYTPMTWKQLLMLLLAGASATAGQFGVTLAYKYAPSREVSVYDYSQVLFSALLGFLLFGDLPDHWSVLGYVLILGAAFLMFCYNNHLFGFGARTGGAKGES